MKIQIPNKLLKVFSGSARYRCSYGGRGSGKTYTFALMLALRGYESPIKVLCCREFQNSIKDSSIAEIKKVIYKYPFLDRFYTITENTIKGENGTEFLFKGLSKNVDSIKSISDIDICWIEEAETMSSTSFSKLRPTIRNENSEIWVTWNPEREDSTVNEFFIKNPPENCKIAKMNYYDNKWFTKELEAERQEDLRRGDMDMYNHVWLGEYLSRSEAQVFRKYQIRKIVLDEKFEGAYNGIDFGFSQDPTAFVQTFVKDNELYIYREAGKKGLELDDTVNFVLRKIPDFANRNSWADCSRPESISYLKRKGLPRIKPCNKWAGSVQDGIEFLKSYKSIIIDESCVETIREFKNYSYKVDKRTGEVLNVIVDKWNHYIDAIRYSQNDMIKRKGKFFLG